MNHLSIIILTYNPNWKKLKGTLLSVLRQEGIFIELIIADDGSSKRFDDKIIALCKQYGKEDIKFSNLKQNAGTICNIAEALKIVTTPYVKLISPGDCLYEAECCKKWINFMQATNANMSFGDAIYYGEQNGSYRIIKHTRAPIQRQLYENKNRRGLMVDCLMANDNILGASLMIETEVLKKYICLFKGKVKYAEDYLVRLAVFENKKILHFSQNVIWYEYGLGISTSKKDKWKKLLYRDFVESNKLIINECTPTDKISIKYVSFLNNEGINGIIIKIKKCLMFPDVIVWRLKNRNSKNYTDTDVDIGQVLSYFEDIY